MKHLATILTGDDLGEGPQWNDRDGRVWWLDIHGRRLHRLDPATGAVSSVETPERIGSFAFLPDRGSRILAAFETGLFELVSTMGKVSTLRISVTLSSRTAKKLAAFQSEQKIKSLSNAASRLIEEALERYPESDQPRLL